MRVRYGPVVLPSRLKRGCGRTWRWRTCKCLAGLPKPVGQPEKPANQPAGASPGLVTTCFEVEIARPGGCYT